MFVASPKMLSVVSCRLSALYLRSISSAIRSDRRTVASMAPGDFDHRKDGIVVEAAEVSSRLIVFSYSQYVLDASLHDRLYAHC